MIMESLISEDSQDELMSWVARLSLNSETPHSMYDAAHASGKLEDSPSQTWAHGSSRKWSLTTVGGVSPFAALHRCQLCRVLADDDTLCLSSGSQSSPSNKDLVSFVGIPSTCLLS